MLQTVQKAAEVLNLFSVDHPEWGISELSKTLAFPKSSTSALVTTLTEQGLLRRTNAGRYKLGWRVMALSQVLLSTTDFRTEARRVMESLIARFGETVHLAALESGQVIYVDKLQGTRAIQVSVTGVGYRLPAHCSGVGKTILADRPWEEVLLILNARGMPPLTPHTITSPEAFRQELERVSAQGYAYDLEEAVEELCCVAAPIRDHSGEVVAAMSLSVPAYRFQQYKDQYRLAIVGAARQVSENLGYIAGKCCRKKSV
ncbi:MAG TPA: IclR family transcriptional regulator [Ktedonobacteraceae bacterium]|nr:IclR family transcriptional regulator [Ktedonobacteraceae bacterium]